MVREWNLSLENTTRGGSLKDPIGYKQDITNVIVTTSRDSGKKTTLDVYENVRITPTPSHESAHS